MWTLYFRMSKLVWLLVSPISFRNGTFPEPLLYISQVDRFPVCNIQWRLCIQNSPTDINHSVRNHSDWCDGYGFRTFISLMDCISNQTAINRPCRSYHPAPAGFTTFVGTVTGNESFQFHSLSSDRAKRSAKMSYLGSWSGHPMGTSTLWQAVSI